MGMISKEDLLKWINKQVNKGNWLQINEVGNQMGRQAIYMTTTGQFVGVQYDLEGKILQVGQPVVLPAAQNSLGLNRR
jgi:hypothetical protein